MCEGVKQPLKKVGPKYKQPLKQPLKKVGPKYNILLK